MPRLKLSRSQGKATRQQLQAVEVAWKVTLPEDYRRFLEQQNGGTPNLGYFDCPCGKGLWVDDLLPIHSKVPAPATVTDFTVQRRELVPPDCLVIGFVCRDDLLLLRVRGRRKGRVDLKSIDELHRLEDASDDPETAVFPVARSFDAFLALLYKAPEDFEPATFALDHTAVRGEKLHQLLKSLGCRKHRIPGSSATNPIWHWPKYRGRWSDSPAWLELEKNKTYGHAPKFDERPVGHPMLRVTAAAAGRVECLRKLEQAFGTRAKLLSRGG